MTFSNGSVESQGVDASDRSRDESTDSPLMRDVPNDRADTTDLTVETQTVDGADGKDYWVEAVGPDGKQVAIVEAQRDGNRLLVHRAEAERSAAGDAGAASIRSHLERGGYSVEVDGSCDPGSDSARRSIAADLSHPSAPADGAETRPDISRLNPSEYREATPDDLSRLTEARQESANPERWVDLINPRSDHPGGVGPSDALSRNQNCADCARCVQDTLDGRPAVAAASSYETKDGIEEWASAKLEPTTYEEVERRLAQPGDSALCTMYRADAPGHAFNAVNIDGEVKYVDGQSHEVRDWPPDLREETTRLEAIFFRGGTVRTETGERE